MGAGGKSGSATVGFRYFMSIHMGVSRGPIDEIVQIDAGDVRAWPLPDGDSEATGGLMTVAEGPDGSGVAQYEDGTSAVLLESDINTIRSGGGYGINAPTLFGGDKKEGGLQGSLEVMMGQPTQTVAGWIKALISGNVPDFRGVCTLFFDGLLTSLNPYPKPWTMRVRRTIGGWDGETWHPELATIWMRDGMIKAANPAHMIYECLTDRSWGRGFPREAIDDARFLACAQTLYDEGFGLCMRWNRQGQLQDFVQDIIDHIGGHFYTDRLSGLLAIGLLRDDYDIDDLPLFTYDSGLLSVEVDETAARDQVVNEVIIEWTDPIGKADRQSRVQNLASIQSLGATNSTTTSYNGIPTSELALRVGQRDLRANATSLKRYKVTLDRRAWRLIPGNVLKISAPDRSINLAVLRAGKVAEQGLLDGKIVVEAVLDVFGLAAASFIATEPAAWQAPDRTASIAADRYVREATYADAVRRFSSLELAALTDASGAIATVAGKPTTGSQAYTIATKTGGEDYAERGSEIFVPTCKLDGGIGIYTTTMDFDQGESLGLVTIGQPIQIGDEICRLDDISVNVDGISGSITVGRGCVDTLPTVHANGATVFFNGLNAGTDDREYAVGETVDVKLLPFTSTQNLSIDLAPVNSIVIAGRHALPWPPGDLTVNGTAYGLVTSVAGTINLDWVHRDRTLIQDQLVDHDDSGTSLESGTTYTIKVFTNLADASPNRTVTGLTGVHWEYDAAMATADGITTTVCFELFAVRAGLESKSKYRFQISRI